jgi:S-adenosylmethionine decarboxylase
MTVMHFGEHITIDGYGGSPILLNRRNGIVTCIEELCAELHMQKLAEVMVVEAPDNQLNDPGGWSAFVIVAESHISVHTFPKRRFLSADVYTCKTGLNVQSVSEFFLRRFELADVEVQHIRRGLRYPAQNVA